MTWWLQPTHDWTAGKPKKLLEVLSYAYGERVAIDRIVRAVGVDLAQGPPVVAEAFEVWRWVLERVAGEGALLSLARYVFSDSAFGVFRRPLAEVFDGADFDGQGQLQAITNPARGLRNPAEVNQIRRNAQYRTAMILLGNEPAGTGFLIGPDLLMTAAHVVSQERTWSAPTKKVVAVFERFAANTAPAESGIPVDVAEWLVGSPPTHEERVGRYQAFGADTDHLDYAIARLSRPVGRDPVAGSPHPRGSYQLYDGYDFTRAPQLSIVGHPLRLAQVETSASPPFVPSLQGTRVRYSGNTFQGSSGSACVDEDGRLVALHHFSTPNENQGVPIAAIIADLRRRELLDRVNDGGSLTSNGAGAADAFTTLRLGPKPFVNRGNLREQVKAMFGNQRGRVLAIEGVKGTGKSYSFSYLSHLASQRDTPSVKQLAPDGISAHVLDLDKYVAVPPNGLSEKLIDDILLTLGVDRPPSSPYAQHARNFNELAMWLPTQLKNDRVLRWLFVDHVDRFTFNDGSKELFQSFVDMVEADLAIPLRLVLVVGEKRALKDDLAMWAERDTTSWLSSEEVVQWLANSLAASGKNIAEATIRGKVDALYAADPQPQSLVLARNVARTLEELGRGAP